MTFDEIVNTFEAKKVGHAWKALCPAHDDKQRSLSLDAGRDGRTVLRCHAGCATEDVLGRRGLQMRDLFETNGHRPTGSTNGRDLRPWAPERQDRVYIYRDETGAPLFESVRLKNPKGFCQRRDAMQRPWSVKGIRRVPYRLNDLQGQRIVYIVEGEKDADRLWELGLAATTNVGGAGKWTDEDTRLLKAAGCEHVAILPDNDEPGHEHALQVARRCAGVGLIVQVVTLPGLPEKGDVSDFLAARSADDFLELALDAPEWTPGSPPVREPATAVIDPPTPSIAAYRFEPAFPPGHFVGDWVETFSRQCDAPLEYHEVVALVTIAQAVPSLTARISGAPDGLRPNLFVLLIGDAGVSRKSTAKGYGVAVLKRALPRVLLPEQMTQESFVESLTLCNGGAALWAIDEFTDMLSKILNSTHLAGMRGLLLEMYASTDYTYRRVSKKLRRKKDDEAETEREEDSFHVSNVTLSVLGCATPTIFSNIDHSAVGSGLLTRFAIVMPEGKPPRLPQFALSGDAIPNDLVVRLKSMSDRMAGRMVEFAEGVLERLDAAIDRPLDEAAQRCQMTVRAGVMARKVAMLAAAGRPVEFALDGQPLTVTLEDADAAIRVMRRWIEYARRFEARTNETSFEINVQRCMAVARGRTVHRRDVARVVHVPAKAMVEIESTLEQRGHIEVETVKPSTGRPAIRWKWVGE